MFSGYKNISTVNYSHFGHQFPANLQVVRELTSELTEHGHPIFKVSGQTLFRRRWRGPLRLVTS